MTVSAFATAADLLRLLVVPAFAWAAYRDVRTRRLPNRLWPPLLAVGLVALAIDAVGAFPFGGYAGRLFLFRVGFSLLFLVPFALVAYRASAFGGADAKALVVLAVAFPTTPSYAVPLSVLPEVTWLHRGLPAHPSALGVTAMAVLTNAVFVGGAYVLALGARNALAGRLSPAAFVGRPTRVDDLPERHGALLDAGGPVPARGLDLDALRMYLRWRGTTLPALRADPDAHRDPASVGATHPPTDGAVDAGPRTDGGRVAPPESDPRAESSAGAESGPTVDIEDAVTTGAGTTPETAVTPDDPWAAERFLDDIEGTAYGTTPETLRTGLDRVTSEETVWVSPGLPFVVPLFVGLVVALAYGDALAVLLGAFGLA
ncbi:A24 family peptidase [Candidatus Halobonum tyrrellensis]|uniref:Peptidase A24B, FlaK domain-containing protein n=1 Tax=Candidatus Halobonum tyrrellensis G22 TaxID=1324957 RepID=V4HII6_9EURY|nr:A24 family peptidase [Candidatus Halobonum tyrrellensis]ESP87739.1 peptidase A24B, FlaK domain-containing protein [Candidatus Halobonum tyrrellensis G22]